jgi:membrane-associated phospholipid phosphatase
MSESIVGSISAAEPALLEGIYRWGIDVIKMAQTIETPAVTALMKILTVAGSELVFIPVLLFTAWCVSEKKGLRLGILLLLSAWLNESLKYLFRQPRPYELDPSVGRVLEISYGFPSGHAQLSLVFLILLAVWAGKKLAPPGRYAIRAAAVFIILLIGFTRLYLGVHFPTDILAGWLLGGISLLIYGVFRRRIEAALFAGGSRITMISCAVITLLMNALLQGDIRPGALFLGFCIGYCLMRIHFPFSARAGTGGKSWLAAFGPRCFVGGLGSVLIYVGLKTLRMGNAIPGMYYVLTRFIYYGLLGIWPTAAAPWLFLHLRIASPPEPPGKD